MVESDWGDSYANLRSLCTLHAPPYMQPHIQIHTIQTDTQTHAKGKKRKRKRVWWLAFIKLTPWGEGISTEECLHHIGPGTSIFVINDWCGRGQPTVGRDAPGLVVVLNDIRKQAEQVIENKPVRAYGFCFGSCLQVPWLWLGSCKMKETFSFPNCFGHGVLSLQ